MRAVLRAALAALAYFASSRLGYAFAVPHSFVTLWPPAGVLLGLLLLSERRDWPSLLAGGFLGCLASDLVTGLTPAFALGTGVANVLESGAVAGFLIWRMRRTIRLTSLRAVLLFVAGGVMGVNAVTAAVGAAVLAQGRVQGFGHAWLAWWIGDGLGMLIVTPVMLTAAVVPRIWRTAPVSAMVESVVLGALLVLVAVLALSGGPHLPLQAATYATFPFLFWAAVRFGPAGAAYAALFVAVITIWYAALGVGPFAPVGASSNAIAMQVFAFLLVVSVASLLPAAVLEERRLAARALLESEGRYRSVVETATDPIITIDEDSRVLFANAAVEQVFGYPPAELVGRDLTMLMPEGLRARHRSGLGQYVETGRRRIEWRGVPLTGRHRDGHEIPLEASFGERDERGQRVFTGILRDLSQRHAAERALREVEDRMRFTLELAHVGLWEVDLATGAARWSETLEALHGLPPGGFGGTLAAFLEHIHPDDREAVRAEIDRSTRLRVDADILYRSVWPDGTTHWLSGVGRASYDADGTPIRSAGIGLDVTERRALEEQYRQAQKMEAVGQLAGGVAHDFNNLLTAIHGFGSLLADALPADSLEQEDVAEILKAADRATTLTRRLLTFSRKEIVAPTVFDLAATLHGLEPMLRRLIGEDVEVVVRTASDGTSVRADAGQLEQVVLNLALNARDAMPQGGLLVLELQRIEVKEDYGRRHVDLTPGSYVMLAVSDTGVGMDAATTARIFEPFFTTKPMGKGTGLGLATVYGIVRQSGGTVLVYSEPGRGTTFKVYLPRVTEAAEAVAPLAPVDARPVSETVMLVEDDEALLRFARRVLETRGYVVLPAASPREALAARAAYGGPVHLLVTDVVLPEMSGRALAEQMREAHPDTRVLFMSGYTDDVIVHRGVLARETQFLQKPFSGADLLQKVREALDL